MAQLIGEAGTVPLGRVWSFMKLSPRLRQGWNGGRMNGGDRTRLGPGVGVYKVSSASVDRHRDVLTKTRQPAYPLVRRAWGTAV